MDPKEEMVTLTSDGRSPPAHAPELASACSAGGTRDQDDSRSRSELDRTAFSTEGSSSDTLVEEDTNLSTEDQDTLVEEEKENLSEETESPSRALDVPKRGVMKVVVDLSSSDEEDLEHFSSAMRRQRLEGRKPVHPRRHLSDGSDTDHDADDENEEQSPSVRLRKWKPLTKELKERWRAASPSKVKADQGSGYSPGSDLTAAPASPESTSPSGSDLELPTPGEAVNEAQASSGEESAHPATRGRVPGRVVTKMPPSSVDSPTSTGTPSKTRSRFYAEPLPPGYVFSKRLGRAVAPPGRSPLTQREVDFDVWRSKQTPDQQQRALLQYPPLPTPTEESSLVYAARRAVARADGLSKEEIEEAQKMTAVLMSNVQQDSRRMLGRDSPFAYTFASQTEVNPASRDQLLKEVVTVVNTGIAVHRRNKLSRRNGKKNGRPLSITQRAMEDAMGEKLLLVGRYLAISGIDDVKL